MTDSHRHQTRFAVEFDSDVITGNINFLQIRNDHIHILDYKPEARKVR